MEKINLLISSNIFFKGRNHGLLVDSSNNFLLPYLEHKGLIFPPVQYSCSVVSDSLRPHGPQHTRPPCPSPTPRVCSNSCPFSWWCHPTISSSVVPLLLPPSIFPSIRVFSNESVLRIRWLKYWSFSFIISPSNEYSGLTSFRIDWFDLFAVQGTLNSLLQHHSSKESVLIFPLMLIHTKSVFPLIKP